MYLFEMCRGAFWGSEGCFLISRAGIGRYFEVALVEVDVFLGKIGEDLREVHMFCRSKRIARGIVILKRHYRSEYSDIRIIESLFEYSNIRSNIGFATTFEYSNTSE